LEEIVDPIQRREQAGERLTESMNQMAFLTMGAIDRMVWAGGFLTVIRGTFPKRAKEGEQSWADYIEGKGLTQQTVSNWMRLYEHRHEIDPTKKVNELLSQISTRVRQQLPPKTGQGEQPQGHTQTSDDPEKMIDQYGRTPTEGDKTKARKYSDEATKYGGSLTYEQALKIILMNKRPPSTTPRKPKPHGVFVPLPTTEEQRIMRLAKREGVEPNQLIRQALKQYIATTGKTKTRRGK
jgi:hypothetical protein